MVGLGGHEVAVDLILPSTRDILNAVAQLDHARGAWSSMPSLPADRLARLKEASKIQSVGASCRLSGVRVTDAEVAAVLAGETLPTREVGEILGYARAMDRAFPADEVFVTPLEIRKLNAVLLGSTPDAPSAWREEPIHLEAFDSEGHALGRVFQTLPPRLIDEKMEQSATWLEYELRAGKHHPLLVIGGFYLVFLNISPFLQANTRTGRAMMGHLLRRAGHAYMPFASLERIFDERREQYYEALDASCTQLWTGGADLEPWLTFYLDALRRHVDRVAAKIELETRSLELPPLQRSILDMIREHGTARAAMLLNSTGTNRNTLKDNLRRMVDRGLLERVGKSKGAFYRLPTGEHGGEA
jgi:Fic family protein